MVEGKTVGNRDLEERECQGREGDQLNETVDC